jgi:protease-4
MSDTAKQVFQLSVEHEYSQFVDKVAEARHQTFEAIDTVAQGRVWAASDAKQRGLIDQTGLLADAVKAAAQRAQLGDKYQQEYFEADLSWRQMLAQQMTAFSARITHALAPDMRMLSTLHQVAPPLGRELQRMQRFATARGTYYYCACTIE